MADLIGDNLAWFYGKLKAHASIDVTYWRASANNNDAGDLAIDVSAIPGKAPVNLIATATGPAPDPKKAPRDFNILASDLVYNSVLINPTPNDWIVEEIDNTRYVYTVAAPMKGGPCFEHDHDHRITTMLLIHTKFAGVGIIVDKIHYTDNYVVNQTDLTFSTDCVTI